MENINLKKIVDYEDSSSFGFIYEGLAYDTYNAEDVKKQIEDFFYKENNHCDMLRNAVYLKTILSCVNEKQLIIEFDNPSTESTIKYVNGNLTLFNCKKYDEKNLRYIEVNFTLEKGLNFNVKNGNTNDKNIIKYSEDLKDVFSQIIDYISHLNQAQAITFNNDTEAIIEVYRLFYNENPNFRKEDIAIKIQSMLSILSLFGYCFGNYSFSNSSLYPESLNILQIIKKLYPLGEITILPYPIELTERAKEVIKIVGSKIRNQITDTMDINKLLISISKTCYAGQYELLSMYDVEKLLEYPNIDISPNEIKFCTKLLKSINERIEKSKY